MSSNDKIRGIIKQILEKHKLTFEEISARSGISRSQISNFLSARRGFTLKSADKILNSFGLEIRVCRKKEAEQ